MFAGKMPQAVKKAGKAGKKPSQQEVGDVVGAAVTDTETREDGTETAVLTDADTQEGGSGLQGPTAASGEDSSDMDTSVKRVRQRLMCLRQS